MKKNTTLALAISAALAFPSVATSTVLLTDAGSASPLKLASEVNVVSAGTNFTLGTDGNLNFVPPAGVVITPTNPAYVKVNLINGAKFLASPGINCVYSGNQSAAGGLTVGGIGSNAVTFQLTNGTLSGASGCTVTGYNGVTLSGQQSQSVSATFEFFDAGIASSKAYKGQLVTFTRGLETTFSDATNSVVIDVSKASKEFVVNGNTVRAKTAQLGSIMFAPSSVAAKDAAGADIDVDGATLMSATARVSGLVIASIGTASSGNIFYLSQSANSNCSAIGAKLSDGKVSGSVVTFTTAITPAQAKAGAAVCVTIDGNTPLEKGQITGSLFATPQTGYTLNTAADSKNLAFVDKNGSSAKVLIVPKTTAPDGLFVRVYNISNVPGKILGTLYSQGTTDGLNTGAGQVLGTGTLIASLAPNAVTILKQSDIATALGIVDAWPGRAWLQVDAEFEGLRVMSLIRSPSGVLTNFSDSACTTPTECGD